MINISLQCLLNNNSSSSLLPSSSIFLAFYVLKKPVYLSSRISYSRFTNCTPGDTDICAKEKRLHKFIEKYWQCECVPIGVFPGSLFSLCTNVFVVRKKITCKKKTWSLLLWNLHSECMGYRAGPQLQISVTCCNRQMLKPRLFPLKAH